ncbi:MAG: cysteine--tRNA ligase, partial [Bacteroidales bacterium]|nr:cysteine--tRNA ligase [Bacteroidales bacterium]
IINSAKAGQIKLGKGDIETLCQLFDDIVFGVLGLKDEETGSEGARKVIDGLMGMVLEQRAAAKAAKDWATSDHIRDSLKALGIQVKDTKDGAEWTLEN